MGKSLTDYAAAHPEQTQLPASEVEQMRTLSGTVKDRQQRQEQAAHTREQVEQMKGSILNQLEQGNAPENVLYTAIKVIGVVTHDPLFAQNGQLALDRLVGELEQPSLFVDTVTIAANRCKQKQEKYLATLKNSATRQVKKFQKLEAALQEIVDMVDDAAV